MTTKEVTKESEERWDKTIDELSDLIIRLRIIPTPYIAYRDAYDKMIEAMEEFAVAHYG